METTSEKSEFDASRTEIDATDNNLIALLARRRVIARKIGEYKFNHNIPVRDERRFEAVVKRLVRVGAERDVPENLIREIWTIIHEDSCKVQEDRMDELRNAA